MRVVIVFILTETEPDFSTIVLKIFFLFFGQFLKREGPTTLSQSNCQELVFESKLNCTDFLKQVRWTVGSPINHAPPHLVLRRFHGL